MEESSIPTTLSPSLYRYFWDVQAEKVNPSVRPEYVINRLLDKGNLDAARWVLSSFPRQTIVETLKTVRDFSPRSARFWARYFGVSDEEVVCLQPSYLKTRRQHWPY